MFILGGIIFSSITVIAVNINASQIDYERNNETIKVNTALDNLYNKVDLYAGAVDEVEVIAPAGMRYAVFENKNFKYFKVSLLDKGSGASCTSYRANVATKTMNIAVDTEYSTETENNRIYFQSSGSYCLFEINYYNVSTNE